MSALFDVGKDELRELLGGELRLVEISATGEDSLDPAMQVVDSRAWQAEDGGNDLEGEVAGEVADCTRPR